MTPNSAGSILIDTPTSCLRVKLRTVKKNLLMRKNIALTRICLVKHLFPAVSKVQ